MIFKLLELLIGLILGVILDWWGRPALLRWLDRVAMQRAKARYRPTRIPDPPKEFTKYRLGNIEIPVMNLLGSPETPFEMDEVRIEYQPIMYHQQSDYPAALADAKPYLEKAYLQRYGLESLPRTGWYNERPRLYGYDQSPELADDKRGELTLYFNLTTFDTYLTTNRSLDYAVIPKSGTVSRFTTNQTVREAYVSFPHDLRTSVLSNPLSATVVVISRNLNQTPKDQVIIRLRKQVVLYRDCYQVSAAGFMSLAHRDESGMPNPFVTAVDEARQEIADRLQPPPSDFKLIGISLNWEDMNLNAYGYIETGLSVQDLLGDFRRDAFEGWLEAIPFEPKAVLSHIAQHKWEPMSVLAMCATLLACFPRDEVEAMARTIPAKTFRDFFENG